MSLTVEERRVKPLLVSVPATLPLLEVDEVVGGGVLLKGLLCQAQKMYWNGRGRSRVRTSRCMAEELRRGMSGRGLASSLEVVEAIAEGCACERLRLRDRARLSSVEDRERDGIDSSSVGKLVVPVDRANVAVIVLLMGRLWWWPGAVSGNAFLLYSAWGRSKVAVTSERERHSARTNGSACEGSRAEQRRTSSRLHE